MEEKFFYEHREEPHIAYEKPSEISRKSPLSYLSREGEGAYADGILEGIVGLFNEETNNYLVELDNFVDRLPSSSLTLFRRIVDVSKRISQRDFQSSLEKESLLLKKRELDNLKDSFWSRFMLLVVPSYCRERSLPLSGTKMSADFWSYTENLLWPKDLESCPDIEKRSNYLFPQIS